MICTKIYKTVQRNKEMFFLRPCILSGMSIPQKKDLRSVKRGFAIIRVRLYMLPKNRSHALNIIEKLLFRAYLYYIYQIVSCLKYTFVKLNVVPKLDPKSWFGWAKFAQKLKIQKVIPVRFQIWSQELGSSSLNIQIS